MIHDAMRSQTHNENALLRSVQLGENSWNINIVLCRKNYKQERKRTEQVELFRRFSSSFALCLSTLVLLFSHASWEVKTEKVSSEAFFLLLPFFPTVLDAVVDPRT